MKVSAENPPLLIHEAVSKYLKMKILLLIILSTCFNIQVIFAQKVDTLELIKTYSKITENSDYILSKKTYIIGNNNIKKKFIKYNNKPEKLSQIEYYTNKHKDSLIQFLSHQISVFIYKNDSLTINNVWRIDSNLNRISLDASTIIKKLKCGIEAKYMVFCSEHLYLSKKSAQKNVKTVYYCNNKKVIEHILKNNNSNKINSFITVKVKTDKNNNVIKKEIIKKGDNKSYKFYKFYKYKYNDTLLIEEKNNRDIDIKSIKYEYENNKLKRITTYSEKQNKVIEEKIFEYYLNGLIKNVKTLMRTKEQDKLIVFYNAAYMYDEKNRIIEKIKKDYIKYQNKYKFTKELYIYK